MLIGPHLQYLVHETLAAEHGAPTPASVPSFPLVRFLSPSVAPLAFIAPTFEPLGGSSVAQELIEMLTTALNELVQPGEIEPALEWSIATEEDSPASDDSIASRAHRPIVMHITAWRNVWSRQARRAAKAAAPSVPVALRAAESAAANRPETPMFDVRIEIAASAKGTPRSETSAKAGAITSVMDQPPASDRARPRATYRLEGWWIRGAEADRAALVGLWGFLTRRIGDECRRRTGSGERHAKEIGRRAEGDDNEEGRGKRRKGE